MLPTSVCLYTKEWCGSVIRVQVIVIWFSGIPTERDNFTDGLADIVKDKIENNAALSGNL